MASSLVQDAIIRQLEVVGEAVKRLPRTVRDAEPQVPWQQIAGLRDRLIHGYDNIDTEIVWGVVERRVPALLAAVERLLVRASRQ